MSHRSRPFFALMTAMCCIMATHEVTAQPDPFPQPTTQPTTQPTAQPTSQPEPKAEIVPLPDPPRPLSAKEIDALVAKTFGADSPEARRPVRLWIATFGAVIAAKEGAVQDDGRSVRLVDVSLRIANDAKILHGDSVVIELLQQIEKITDVDRSLAHRIVVRQKDRTVTFASPIVDGKDADIVQIQAGARRGVPPPPPDNQALAEKLEQRSRLDLRSLDVRFGFKIDPASPPAKLLPVAPAAAKLPAPLNEDLSKVPELMFTDPMSRSLSKLEAMEAIAHTTAKINLLNAAKNDGFMIAMLERRPDLRGLPVRMGDECRTREEQARVFAEVAEAIQQALQSVRNNGDRIEENAADFWIQVADVNLEFLEAGRGAKARINRATQEHAHQATVAALMQILMPESETFRIGLAKYLSTVPHIDATRALAKLAIFSAEEEVRAAAIDALKLRRERDYTDVLVQGFRYPLPAVAKRSAEALVKLERTDVLADLIDVLDRPDPRLPVTMKEDGKDVTTVRELVKINHHRNCLLCHAPGNTENIPQGVLKVAVPLPGEPLTNPSEGGGYNRTPPTGDILVRLDMTYLRQDFSLRMPVADAHPWPDMQRFDFLVRQRTLTPEEAKAYPSGEAESGRLPVHHRAALFALRELTGRDTEPTAAAWRKMLKIGKTS